MRKVLLSLLLASVAATPALAGPRDDDNDRRAAKAERQQVREERQQSREDRAPRERPQVSGQGQNTGQGPQNFTGGGNNGGAPTQYVHRQNYQRNVQPVQQANDGSNDARNYRRIRNADGVQTPQPRDGRRLTSPFRRMVGAPVVSDTPRPGTQPPPRTDNHHHNRSDWNTNWRSDHRYNWNDWRNRNRSIFHLGFYYDPFGWGYQPYSIGWRLWPNYYSSNYWINDPWQYRLPYAPPGTQWVRYYNDAILVDMYSGQVVDVIYNFFW